MIMERSKARKLVCWFILSITVFGCASAIQIPLGTMEGPELVGQQKRFTFGEASQESATQEEARSENADLEFSGTQSAQSLQLARSTEFNKQWIAPFTGAWVDGGGGWDIGFRFYWLGPLVARAKKSLWQEGPFSGAFLSEIGFQQKQKNNSSDWNIKGAVLSGYRMDESLLFYGSLAADFHQLKAVSDSTGVTGAPYYWGPSIGSRWDFLDLYLQAEFQYVFFSFENKLSKTVGFGVLVGAHL
jgi:hypothetical protein